MTIQSCRDRNDDAIPQSVRLGVIPGTAEIVYQQDGFIYVMDRNGENVAQITFDHPRNYEHEAVSYDHRYMAANEQLPNPSDHPGGNSRLWLFDLEHGTEVRLLPQFITAGNGGVDWGSDGFIYFSAQEKDSVANPKTPQEFMANAAANDIYRVQCDGTNLQRLTHTTMHAESDVDVSPDGTMLAYGNFSFPDQYSEIWVSNTDGSNAYRVFKGPTVQQPTWCVADPVLSPDNKQVFFSKYNPDVPPNFPANSLANTAHDIYSINVDGTDLKRLSIPGPISICPDWKDNLIVFLTASETNKYAGITTIRAGLTEQQPRLIKEGANLPQWIPFKNK